MPAVRVLSLPIPRVELERVFRDPRMVRAIESLFTDVIQTLPEAIDGQTVDLQAEIDAATATANTANSNASTALSTANTAFLLAGALAMLLDPLVLTDGATIAVDASAHRVFSVTLGGNRTLQFPTGLADGAVLHFIVRQDATGGRTLAYDGGYDFGAAGLPQLNPTPGAVAYFLGIFDQATSKVLCIARSSVAPPRFSAHNGGTSQNITTATPTKVTLGTEVYDVGGAFASSAWTPRAGLVQVRGAVTLVLTGAATVTASIYKNGAEFKRGAAVQAGAAGSVTVSAACEDQANGTDYYELWVLQSAGSTQPTDGAAAATWFQGAFLAP